MRVCVCVCVCARTLLLLSTSSILNHFVISVPPAVLQAFSYWKLRRIWSARDSRGDDPLVRRWDRQWRVCTNVDSAELQKVLHPVAPRIRSMATGFTVRVGIAFPKACWFSGSRTQIPPPPFHRKQPQETRVSHLIAPRIRSLATGFTVRARVAIDIPKVCLFFRK